MKQKVSCIGKNLKTLRKISGLTQGQVARALNISYQQVQKYESGGNRIPVEKLFELKNFYNVPYEIFFDGFDETYIYTGNYMTELFIKLGALDDVNLRKKLERAILIFLE